MEELRSTEILDKEIIEDARKKAEQILKNSETSAEEIGSEVSKRVEKVRKEKEQAYNEKIASFSKDVDAAIPLEKERLLVAFENKEVATAIGAYIEALPLEKKIALLTKKLGRYKDILKGRSLNVSVCGFDIEHIKKLLSIELSDSKILAVKEMTSAEAQEHILVTDKAQGFVIESQDRMIICRVTIGEMLNELVDKYSYELASTLFCGSLPV